MFELKKTGPLFLGAALAACSPHEAPVGRGMPTEPVCEAPNRSINVYAEEVLIIAEQAAKSGGPTADIGPLILNCPDSAVELAWNTVHALPESDLQWTVLQVIERGEARADEIRTEADDSI